MAHREVLFILTSHADMEGSNNKTGVWLGEFTDPYYAFIDAGYHVTLATPLGGEPPIDPLSKMTENLSTSNQRFLKDQDAQDALANTIQLKVINAFDYDIAFVPGGHGPLWDLHDNDDVARILTHFVSASKITGAVCHGPAALLAIEQNIFGYLRNKKITSFTNIEEKLVLRSGLIPYELESRLRAHGVDFSSAILPFMSHVVVDENLVTGQNPLSALGVAKKVIELAQKHYTSVL
ncbi:type 1 glutamine amidotransferase domain-containing protein [Sphingobacterium suaedae]|uniref:Type 1 glutamine amidotransferase domain-containing protein n=1 Tax=Sphingobacterium suaedae TaxID=1686402 RepID=A0ABW5KHH5_9SPHI